MPKRLRFEILRFTQYDKNYFATAQYDNNFVILSGVQSTKRKISFLLRYFVSLSMTREEILAHA
ncbi:hypothetical protein [Campylobacter troglodytis]|uniref:hypothetical protein n=1 Tax=Campylobacter troglodytis TaxID=654363 RepID=UPI00115BF8A1|nr:hypothetical protein [Campylobacter troglodytis]